MKIDKIFIASDHAGFDLKAQICGLLKNEGFDVCDLGTHNTDSVDYPDFAELMAQNLRGNEYGVLICGTGIGISIAANRHSHVRCALCHDVTTAKLSRDHNDSNVLAMGAITIGDAVAADMIKAFFATEFAGGRHERRVKKLGGEK